VSTAIGSGLGCDGRDLPTGWCGGPGRSTGAHGRDDGGRRAPAVCSAAQRRGSGAVSKRKEVTDAAAERARRRVM
jgi:hypothetical protein